MKVLRQATLAWPRALVHSPGWWVFVLLAATYGLSFTGNFLISDGEVVFQAAVAIAERGDLAVACNPGLPQIVIGADGRCYSKYALGLPLLAAGAHRLGVALAPLVGGANVAPVAVGHFFVAALNPLLTALTGMLLFYLARDVLGSRWLALVLALLYGWTTSAWPYANVFFAEPLVAFLYTLAGHALVRVRPTGRAALGWALLAGVALGGAVLTKVASAIVLPVFGLYLIWRLVAALPSPTAPLAGGLGTAGTFTRIGPWLAARRAARPRRGRRGVVTEALPVPLRRPRTSTSQTVGTPPTNGVERSPMRLISFGHLAAGVLAFGLPVLAMVAVTAWHNQARFGHPLESGYAGESFSTPLWIGLYGLLLSSGKSVFLYSPIAAAGVWALVRHWRRWPAEALLCAGVFGVTLVYYAGWWAWYGGWSWGPRFLVPVLPYLVLPVGFLLAQRRWWWVATLGVLGLPVQLLGVLVDFNAFIAAVTGGNQALEGLYLFDPAHWPLAAHWASLQAGEHGIVNAWRMESLGVRPRLALVLPWAMLSAGATAVVALVWVLRPVRRPAQGAEGRGERRV